MPQSTETPVWLEVYQAMKKLREAGDFILQEWREGGWHDVDVADTFGDAASMLSLAQNAAAITGTQVRVVKMVRLKVE